jgi:hypothetical protein
MYLIGYPSPKKPFHDSAKAERIMPGAGNGKSEQDLFIGASQSYLKTKVLSCKIYIRPKAADDEAG